MSDRMRELTLLSVVAPVLNEEDIVLEFHARVSQALESVPFELILIDDGSDDSTPELLDRLAVEDPRVRVVHLSRRFGHQQALTAGLDHARGDVVVSLDGDLQDPPELIPRLLESWRAGNDIVVAVRKLRMGEPRWRRKTIETFYRLFGRISEVGYSANAGDFRLLGREPLDVLRAMPERARFLRGMSRWIGFRQAEVAYDRDARFAGETKYPVLRLMRLAFDGLASFSRVPLQVATYFGFAAAALAFIGIPVAIVLRILDLYVPGIISVILVVLGLGGVQLITLGIIGEYIARIYDEVKGRPIYVVRERVNVGPPDPPEPGVRAESQAGAAL